MTREDPPLVLPVLALAALVATLVLFRILRRALRPSEIDSFRTASSLTTAWARGEAWPPPSPQEEPGEAQPTERQGLSRSSRR